MLIGFNKPWGVLSQFTDKSMADGERQTLSNFVSVPKVYPAGRLDRDSEGLLLLTDNGKLQARIASPKAKMRKVYFVHVEGEPSKQAITQLREGVTLKDGLTKPALVEQVDEPDWVWARNPPIRIRKSVPDSWLKLTITEGRNRQVRRMTAHVGHPTLRLIRYGIGDWTIQGLPQGQWHELSV